MPEQTYRAGHWWYRGDDGSWLRWDESRQVWEPQPGPPPAEAVGLPLPPAVAYRNPWLPWRWVVVLLAFGIVLDAVAVASDVAEYALLSRIAAGAFVSPSEAEASDTRQAVIGLLQLVVFLVTGGLFVWWFHTVYSNLPALGATDLRFRRGWAIGAWFVPFLNLIRPKAMADDVWRASDPALPPAQGAAWRGGPVPALLHWWWGMLILSWLIGRFANLFAREAETLSQLRRTSASFITSDLAGVVTGTLALLVVLRVTRRQADRASAIGLS